MRTRDPSALIVTVGGAGATGKAFERRLEAMKATAQSPCMENRMPHVLGLEPRGDIPRVVPGIRAGPVR